jgi:PilZ domain-containing protein
MSMRYTRAGTQVGDMIELNQRVYSRILTDEPARILINGCSELVCFVRDVSTGGAGLELDPVAVLPHQFHLIYRGMDVRSCRMVWRFADRIGIAFYDVSPVSAMCDGPSHC